MNKLDVNTLDQKTTKVSKKNTPAVVERHGISIKTKLLLTSVVLNVVTGSVLYFNGNLLVNDWKEQIHSMTGSIKEAKGSVTQIATASAQTKEATASSELEDLVKQCVGKDGSEGQFVVDPTMKGGGVCYPKAK